MEYVPSGFTYSTPFNVLTLNLFVFVPFTKSPQIVTVFSVLLIMLYIQRQSVLHGEYASYRVFNLNLTIIFILNCYSNGYSTHRMLQRQPYMECSYAPLYIYPMLLIFAHPTSLRMIEFGIFQGIYTPRYSILRGCTLVL